MGALLADHCLRCWLILRWVSAGCHWTREPLSQQDIQDRIHQKLRTVERDVYCIRWNGCWTVVLRVYIRPLLSQVESTRLDDHLVHLCNPWIWRMGSWRHSFGTVRSSHSVSLFAWNRYWVRLFRTMPTLFAMLIALVLCSGEYPAGSVGCAESSGELKEGHRNRWFIMYVFDDPKPSPLIDYRCRHHRQAHRLSGKPAQLGTCPANFMFLLTLHLYSL